tara:strand:+ start:396 stop:959 length:564 start_codon:yes stop_codon:yes gene_type:complete
MNLLIIDLFDSFTYNLMHICKKYIKHVDVIRVNQVNIKQLDKYEKIIISPGPGIPSDYPILFKILKKYEYKKSILGICLGFQVIAIHYGGSIYNLSQVMHGKKSLINQVFTSESIYKSIPNSFFVGRYHSWGIKLKDEKKLIITSKDSKGCIMSFRNKLNTIVGIQYHPESILTKYGDLILKNWLNN